MSRLFKTLSQEAVPATRAEKIALEKGVPENAGVAAPPAIEKNAAGKKTPPDQADREVRPTGPDPGPKTELLFSWKASGINPRLLTAYRPGTDPTNPNNLVTVNVRDNRNFLAHMRLKVSQVSKTVFDFVGPLPRWRGRY